MVVAGVAGVAVVLVVVVVAGAVHVVVVLVAAAASDMLCNRSAKKPALRPTQSHRGRLAVVLGKAKAEACGWDKLHTSQG